MAAADLPAVIDGVGPEETVFWSGAGVSAEAPTYAPLGAELTSRALRYGFQPETGPLLECYYRALGLERRQPRLETILDVLHRLHGGDLLLDLLSDLEQAAPN